MKNILLLTSLLLLPVIVASALNRLAARNLLSPQFAARLGLVLVLFTTGAAHFAQTSRMAMLLPPWVPRGEQLILFTGVLELAAAISLLIRATTRPAAYALIFFFVAVFPANIWAAFNHINFGGHAIGPAYLLVRSPFQLLLILWSWRIAQPAIREEAALRFHSTSRNCSTQQTTSCAV